MWCTRSRSRAYTEFPGRQAHNLAFSGATSPFCASSHSLAFVRERPHIPSLLSLFTEHAIASFCLMRCAQIKNCSFFLLPLESLLLLRLLGIEEPADTLCTQFPSCRNVASEVLLMRRLDTTGLALAALSAVFNGSFSVFAKLPSVESVRKAGAC